LYSDEYAVVDGRGRVTIATHLHQQVLLLGEQVIATPEPEIRSTIIYRGEMLQVREDILSSVGNRFG